MRKSYKKKKFSVFAVQIPTLSFNMSLSVDIYEWNVYKQFLKFKNRNFPLFQLDFNGNFICDKI